MLTIKNWGGKKHAFLLALGTFLLGCAPPGPRALLAGKQLIEQGKYAQAVERLKTATMLMKTNALAWSCLGLAYQQVGQTAEAEKAYLQALSLDRELAEVNYNLGCLWLAENRPEAAKSALTAFTLRRSDSVDGFLKLGTAQLRLREVAPAERSFGAALRLSPQQPEALNGLGLARLQRGMHRDAMLFFDGALKQRPDYYPALLNQAVVAHIYLRDRRLALQKYQAYLALKPEGAEARNVASLVRQLEAELAPAPRIVVTNVPSLPPTNSQNLIATNAPRQAPTSAPPARLTSTPKPEAPPPATPKPHLVTAPTTNQVKPSAGITQPPSPARTETPKPAKVDVVKLSPEPEVKPVRDLPTQPTSQPVTATSSLPARLAPQQPAVTTPAPRGQSPQPGVTPAAPSGPVANVQPAKRGLLHNINPLNLLRSDEKAAPRVTPLPSVPSSPTESAGVASNSGAAPPAPSVPRYAYRRPGKPSPGNRPQAERSFAQGLQAQEARRYSEAIQAYRAATQADPSFFEAQYNLGQAGTAANDVSTALAAYEMALAIQPDSLEARYNFGLALQQAKYPLDAAAELEKVSASRPDDVRIHLALGNLYAQPLRQPAKAREHYTRVIELDPRNPQVSAIRFWLAANPP